MFEIHPSRGLYRIGTVPDSFANLFSRKVQMSPRRTSILASRLGAVLCQANMLVRPLLLQSEGGERWASRVSEAWVWLIHTRRVLHLRHILFGPQGSCRFHSLQAKRTLPWSKSAFCKGLSFVKCMDVARLPAEHDAALECMEDDARSQNLSSTAIRSVSE